MVELADIAIERRFQRNTYFVIAVALGSALWWSGWQMLLGVALGAALGLFNQRWLRSSVNAIMGQAVLTQNGSVPPFTAAKFILRYYLIALAIGGAIFTTWFHPLGLGVGFAAFVGGVMIEAGYQLYLALRASDLAPTDSTVAAAMPGEPSEATTEIDNLNSAKTNSAE